MNEITNTTESNLTTLERVTAEARILRMSINMNMFHLARVLVEAKEVVPHGEWLAWIRDNADVSEKTAEDMMAAYRRFKDNPQIQQLAPSKTFKLLALPAGAEGAFMEQHDVENMTVRQIAEAVKKARAEEQEKARQTIERERALREDAEDRARELEMRPPEVPEEVAEELRQAKEQARNEKQQHDYFANRARELGNENVRLNREKDALAAEKGKFEEREKKQQDKYDELYKDFCNLKSAQKRGDGDRPEGDTLTIQVFTAAVREFMAMCASMPYMGAVFADMDEKERRSYDVQLKAIEGWANDSRRALNSYILEGEVVDV